jgi:hypothetical protein
MKRALKWIGQGIAYLLFAAVIGLFSTWPAYSLLEPDQALLRLSFKHPGKVSTECRQRTPEELARLMRSEYERWGKIIRTHGIKGE